ncbi:MAG: hypothetical protein H6738_13415 [Alphaproteobacteria bacterium]|nr:hypothetical protein [Alphaproteobacteria bacterium]MCB9697776.1 hypothetical protein [Alphaproteobacteria bacterium]
MNRRLALLVALIAVGSSSVGVAAPTTASEDFVVTGEVLKPEITVVISRENLNKPFDLKLDENFLDRIIESVKQPPF